MEARMTDFAALMEKERERLNKAREDALTRRSGIDNEIAIIDKELMAIAAYEAAKTGKPPRVSKAHSTGARRGSRQEAILAQLQSKPDGLTRGELLEALGLKGDKTGGQSVSNALNNMKKAGKLGQRDGKYMLA
jgi:hypothetical protein